MSNVSSGKRDMVASVEGVWVNDCWYGADIKVAATCSRKYRDYIQQLMKPYAKSTASMKNEFFEANIQNPAMARFILVDWRKWNDNGTEVPYSEAKALEVLNDPENFDFRELVVNLSNEAELYRKEALAELKKS